MRAAHAARLGAAHLEFVIADLMADAGWPDAVSDCDYVLHVASPFPGAEPEHDDELIVPARDGALRVLRAARDARVKRVVLTSSFRGDRVHPEKRRRAVRRGRLDRS